MPHRGVEESWSIDAQHQCRREFGPAGQGGQIGQGHSRRREILQIHGRSQRSRRRENARRPADSVADGRCGGGHRRPDRSARRLSGAQVRGQGRRREVHPDGGEEGPLVADPRRDHEGVPGRSARRPDAAGGLRHEPADGRTARRLLGDLHRRRVRQGHPDRECGAFAGARCDLDRLQPGPDRRRGAGHAEAEGAGQARHAPVAVPGPGHPDLGAGVGTSAEAGQRRRQAHQRVHQRAAAQPVHLPGGRRGLREPDLRHRQPAAVRPRSPGPGRGADGRQGPAPRCVGDERRRQPGLPGGGMPGLPGGIPGLPGVPGAPDAPGAPGGPQGGGQ